MSVAVERPVRDDVPAVPPRSPARVSSGLAVALLAGLVALIGASIFASDGSSDSALFPIGAGVLGLLILAWGGVAIGAIPRPVPGRAGLACALLLGLLALWSLVSVTWSIAPDRSWDAFNRSLVYLALLLLGTVAGAVVRRAPTVVAGSLGVLVAATLAWSLAARVFPGLDADGGRIARLRIPIGYWNALALLLVIAMPIALWASSERRHPAALRALAVLFLYVLLVGVLLTYSRGGIVAGVVALAIWLALSRSRLESVVALLIAGCLAGGVFAFALGRPGVVDDEQSLARRVADGHAFGIALLIGAALAFGFALILARLESRRPLSAETRLRVSRGGRLGAVALVAVVAVLLGVRGASFGGWVERQADEFANPPTTLLTQESARLTSLSSNNRWTWWNEAWRAFRSSPVEGTGAGSFVVVHQILRKDSLTVTEPHNAVLQFLSDTGIVGALLACGAAIAALVGAFAALRRLPGRERAPALALAAGIAAYVVHSLVDFDWSFIAVTAPALVATGVLVASGRPSQRPRASLVWLAALVAVVAAAAISLGAPWLSERRVDQAYAALGAGHARLALDRAASARSLNPLSLDPLLARSAAQTALGDVTGARASLIDGVELQPLNGDSWYELGTFELHVTQQRAAALRYLNRSLELDPGGVAKKLLEGGRG